MARVQIIHGMLMLAILAAPVAAETTPLPRDQPITNNTGMKFVRIPPGEYLRGSPTDENAREADEHQHKVRLTRPFYLGVTEVTQKQWHAVMGHHPAGVRGDDLPANRISWHDAVTFCLRLSAQDGRKYRLPTEAEWEYACRAGTTGPHAGNVDDLAWYHANSDQQTRPVATRQPNAWGLYDMHGNVWEWCSDIYGPYPRGMTIDPASVLPGDYQPPPAIECELPMHATAPVRVLRGGSWTNPVFGCRSARRDWALPDAASDTVGFRVVLDMPD